MKKIRFAIVGFGNMGTAHANNLYEGKIENGLLSAIVDTNIDNLTKAKNKFGDKVSYYNTIDELILSNNTDAIIIATPHYSHSELSIKALKAGYNVICEKPAGVYTKQVKQMNDVASQSKGLFTIMFNQRTNSLYRKMREIVLEKGIGEIKRINWLITNWYRSQSYYDSSEWRATWAGEGGGVLVNQCPHQLDLLQWVTGMMPFKIHAFCHFGKWHDIEVEDDVTAYIEYANGATGVFVTSTADCPGTNRFEILGTLGKLVCENENLTYTKLVEDEREYTKSFTGGFGEPKSEVIPVELDGKNPQHIGILNNFANAVLGLEPLFVDGREGIKGVEIMNAILLSQWLGKAIEMPFDDDLYYDELKKFIAISKPKKKGSVTLNVSETYGGSK